jgi:hypothetical protein
MVYNHERPSKANPNAEDNAEKGTTMEAAKHLPQTGWMDGWECR